MCVDVDACASFETKISVFHKLKSNVGAAALGAFTDYSKVTA